MGHVGHTVVEGPDLNGAHDKGVQPTSLRSVENFKKHNHDRQQQGKKERAARVRVRHLESRSILVPDPPSPPPPPKKPPWLIAAVSDGGLELIRPRDLLGGL